MSKLRELLKFEEGFRSTPYRCSEGKLTIGYGHNLDAKGISKEAAEVILSDDIADANAAACRYSWIWDLSRARQDVVAAMIFQLGADGFHKFRKLRAALERRDFVGACAEMLDSDWARQTPERARRMVEVMRTGEH